MERLIYVHIVRLGLSLNESFNDSRYTDATNDWYVIKQNSNGGGVEMTRVFEDVNPLNYPDPALLDTSCEVIGSCIYVIGGLSVMCRRQYQIGDDKGSREIRCLDTHNPKDGWRTCFTLPFSWSGGKSVVVDDEWLYLFAGDRHNGSLPPDPWGYAVSVDDNKSIEERVREISGPCNLFYPPIFSTCLSPSTLVAYMEVDCTLHRLVCMNSSWTVYQKDLPYTPTKLLGCTTILDGILYIYDSHNMQLTSYDIRNKKELHVVDLPRSFWFGLDDAVELIVLSKNRFCIIRDMHGDDINELQIYYTRFSVSDDPKPSVSIEERRSFHVDGCRLLNVVAVDPHSDVVKSSSRNSRSK